MTVTSFSLRRRMLLGSVVAIVVATILAGIGIDAISGLAIRALELSEIEDEMRLLLGSIEVNASNQLTIDEGPQDPRFELPNGGLYWQVGRGGNVELRSQSLWDQGLPWLQATAAKGGGKVNDLVGPNGSQLLAVERSIVISTASGDQTVNALIALDNAQLSPVKWRFFYAMAPSLAVLMAALLGAVIVFLRYGFRPLDKLSVELLSLRSRPARKISGRYPDEIQPLIDNLNALIASREAQLIEARSRAGDLAHGLKTPLAVLEATARSLADGGQVTAANAIRDEVWRMDAQVKRTLAEARASLAAAQLSGRVDTHAVLSKLVSTMHKLSRDKDMRFGLEAPQGVVLAMDESDFTNIAGNLLDNARKWGNSQARVRLTAETASPVIVLSIEDDGPGLPPDAEKSFIERGKRLDESVRGTGFGLAIAKDIIEAYGGELHIARSGLGGLGVEVHLPKRLIVTDAGDVAAAGEGRPSA
ncbi:sensor histidine kinase [Labrys sp. ZIDIC5]|uniref:sensor histidine kinase n=1 Tax=Labrys sedimenti TaxID=3106036 RepID=UPI002ACA5E85|nr:sensor histidine kinase [Labrys sp. ZIDIC5]MDZ5450586.1 sensor histidine kinase [Labrys sp. ZIDIC5]